MSMSGLTFKPPLFIFPRKYKEMWILRNKITMNTSDKHLLIKQKVNKTILRIILQHLHLRNSNTHLPYLNCFIRLKITKLILTQTTSLNKSKHVHLTLVFQRMLTMIWISNNKNHYIILFNRRFQRTNTHHLCKRFR